MSEARAAESAISLDFPAVTGHTASGFKFPLGTVSIMALIRHNARIYRTLATLAAILKMVHADDSEIEAHPLNTESIRGDIAERLRIIREDRISYGDFKAIRKNIDRTLELLQDGEPTKWIPALQELNKWVEDSLTEEVYVISPPLDSHYEEPFAGWADVPARFARASDDIEYAEKAYALGLPTACVFHCMGIMHQGILGLCDDLNATVNPITDTWERMIEAVDGGVKVKRTKMDYADWKLVEPFYEEAVTGLRSVKNAWRNPTMHFTRTYNEEQAAKALRWVREFMVHIATRIQEKP